MIYTRFGSAVTFTRHATPEDIHGLEGRRIDAADYQNLANGCYVVGKRLEDGRELLLSFAFLRADGGSRECSEAFNALGTSPLAGMTAADIRDQYQERAKARRKGVQP